MAVTFLAAIVTVTLAALADLVFDEDKIAVLDDSAAGDPLVADGGALPARGKAAAVLCVQLLSIILLTQSARLYVHASFYCRSVALRDPDSPLPAHFNTALQRGQLTFMLGLRTFYLSIMLAFWLLGALSLLLAALAILAVLAVMDLAVPVPPDGQPGPAGPVTAREVEAARAELSQARHRNQA